MKVILGSHGNTICPRGHVSKALEEHAAFTNAYNEDWRDSVQRDVWWLQASQSL